MSAYTKSLPPYPLRTRLPPPHRQSWTASPRLPHLSRTCPPGPLGRRAHQEPLRTGGSKRREERGSGDGQPPHLLGPAVRAASPRGALTADPHSNCPPAT